MISVSVWDKSMVGPVEKAIRAAGLGLNPIVDGQTLRIPVPPLTEERRADIARGVQDAIVDTLLRKTARAIEATHIPDVVVAGGVGANLALREGLGALARRHGGRIYHPRIEFCTDNAAMIAVAGLLRLRRGGAATDLAIQARSQWPLMELARGAPADTELTGTFKEQA